MTNKPVTEAGLIELDGVKVYVAGPMTGLPEFNRPAFFAAEAHLKELGSVVVNPAVLPDGFSHDAYMRMCIPMMMECDAVAFLPGWQQSKGRGRSSPVLTPSGWISISWMLARWRVNCGSPVLRRWIYKGRR